MSPPFHGADNCSYQSDDFQINYIVVCGSYSMNQSYSMKQPEQSSFQA